MASIMIVITFSYALICLEKLAFGNIFAFLENVFADTTEEYRMERDKKVGHNLYKFILSLLLAALCLMIF